MTTVYINFAIAAALNFKFDNPIGRSAESILEEAGSLELIGRDIAVIKSFDAVIKSGKTLQEFSDFLEREENKINFLPSK